jgi:hypothetical protein
MRWAIKHIKKHFSFFEERSGGVAAIEQPPQTGNEAQYNGAKV